MSHSCIPALCGSETFQSLLSRSAKSTQNQGKARLGLAVVLVLARTGLILGTGQDPEVIHWWGQEKGNLFQGEQVLCCSTGNCPVFIIRGVSVWIVSFLVPSLIRIVAVYVCFLISLMLPVNCSYLNLWSLFLCLQFSSSSCCSGWREGEMGEQERAGGSLEGEGAELGSTIPKTQQLHGPATAHPLGRSGPFQNKQIALQNPYILCQFWYF